MFNTLDEYYDYLETQKELLKDNFTISNISKMQDKTADENLRNLMSHEIYFENFKISHAELSLTDDAANYLKERATNARNPKFLAKYNHMLWLYTKNLAYAQLAIDNYLVMLKDSNFDINDNLSNQAFASTFKIKFGLAQEVRYKKDEILEYLFNILGNRKVNGYQEYALMSLIALEGKKVNDALIAIFNYANNVIDLNIYPDFLEEYIKLQLVVSQKIQKPVIPFHNRLAALYLEKSEKHLGTFVVQNYYTKAMMHYQKAGNKVKVEEVSVLMENAKNTLNLKSVPFEFSDPVLDEFFETVENHIENLISDYDAEILYQYLILCPDIFPKAEQLTNNLSNVFMELVSVTTFDHNKNISGKSGGGFNVYDIMIKSTSIRQLSILFQKGFTSGKLSFETLEDYILKNTWYGYNATYAKPNGAQVEFRWADLILPSLQNFFMQTEIDYRLDKYHHQKYMLCTDSLTLKFEGLLREFSRRIGAQTIEIKDNSTEERIAFEKLLDNPKFVDLVAADDIALFKYLFTNQGVNLRNNIAHSFFLPFNYSVQWMWLLVAAILKLGNYKISN